MLLKEKINSNENKKEQINKIAKNINKEKKDLDVAKILENEQKELKKDIDHVNSFTEEEKAYWIIEKHNSFVETINWTIEQDFLSGDSPFARYLILTYMQQLIDLLTIYEIGFTKTMIDVLIKENCVELLAILNVFNYI